MTDADNTGQAEIKSNKKEEIKISASAGDVETIPIAKQTMNTIARRFAELIFLLLFVSSLLFFLLRLTGDPAAVLAGETGDLEQLELITDLLKNKPKN